jgi:hypothetical protein
MRLFGSNLVHAASVASSLLEAFIKTFNPENFVTAFKPLQNAIPNRLLRFSVKEI